MGWLQLTIGSDASRAEEIGELLEEFGADSVSYIPQTPEPVFADDPGSPVYWERTDVMALLDASIDIDILIFCVRNRIGTENILHHRIRILQDRAWAESHREGHGPKTYNGRLCVCPSWCTPPAEVTHILRLDPGLAFGSGLHATTALCLEWLSQSALEGKRVIDYGCGSGILALAALEMGAGDARAVDVDDQALLATRENAANNHLDDRLTVSAPADMPTGQGDILVANILLNPLQELAPFFHELVRPGGSVVLSGILSSQAEECRDRYRHWFAMAEPRFRDEWALLHGTRKPPASAD